MAHQWKLEFENNAGQKNTILANHDGTFTMQSGVPNRPVQMHEMSHVMMMVDHMDALGLKKMECTKQALP